MALGCDMFDCVFPTRTAVRLWAEGVGVWGVPKWGGGLDGEHLVDLVFLTCPPALWLCPGVHRKPAAEEEAVPERFPPHRP